MESDPSPRRRSGRRDRSSKTPKQQPLAGPAEAAAPSIGPETSDTRSPYVLRHGDLGVEVPNPEYADPELSLLPDVHAEHNPGKRSFLKLRGRLGELAILGGLLPAVTLWLGAEAHLSSEMLGAIVIVEEIVALATIAIHRYFDDRHDQRISDKVTRLPRS